MRKEKEKEKVLNPEVEVFKRSELPGNYTAKVLFGWNDGKFEDKYLKKLENSRLIFTNKVVLKSPK